MILCRAECERQGERSHRGECHLSAGTAGYGVKLFTLDCRENRSRATMVRCLRDPTHRLLLTDCKMRLTVLNT